MTGRALVEAILARQDTGGVSAFWVGHPADDAKAIYYAALGVEEESFDENAQKNREASVLRATSGGRAEVDFALAIGSDMIWFSPELNMHSWKHPDGKPMWDCFPQKRVSLTDPGVFADIEDPAALEDFDWPNPDHLDLAPTLDEVRYAYDKGLAVFGGMWCPFFHVLCDFFGMENYFVKMITQPEVVHEATKRVVAFYREANRRVFDAMGRYLTAGFLGNDLGSQRGPMIGPAQFEAFLAPYLQAIIGDIRETGLPVAFHSCGAVDSLIPRFVDFGVSILHPLQALAAGMDADSLAPKYHDKLIFLGGVDTQNLLPFRGAEEVRAETLRLREVFGPGYIVSPSHEALLPNVPLENVTAMSRAAKEILPTHGAR